MINDSKNNSNGQAWSSCTAAGASERDKMGSALIGSLRTSCFCCDRGTFWVFPLTYFYLPEAPGLTFCPNPSKIVTFAAVALVLTPFCPQPRYYIILCIVIVHYMCNTVQPIYVIVYVVSVCSIIWYDLPAAKAPPGGHLRRLLGGPRARGGGVVY